MPCFITRARSSPTPRSGFVQTPEFQLLRPSRKVQTLGGIAGGRSISSCFSSFPSGMQDQREQAEVSRFWPYLASRLYSLYFLWIDSCHKLYL